jgi:hypothetical protein
VAVLAAIIARRLASLPRYRPAGRLTDSRLQILGANGRVRRQRVCGITEGELQHLGIARLDDVSLVAGLAAGPPH